MYELRRLELVKGKKVDHPQGGSKDLADAVAGSVFNCVTNQNNFMFWIEGKDKGKTQEEIAKEQTIYTVDGLVPYGYWGFHRRG